MNFKKIFTAVASTVVMFTALTAYANANIKVYVDNVEVKMDASPTLVDGRVMVPVRAVFESAGAKVQWNDETRVTTLTLDDYEVTIKVGDPFLIKNGTARALDVPASIIEDSLAIPVRAIAEAMDFGVTWNGIRNSVLISTNGKTYRANAQWKSGFHPLSDAGFVASYNLDDVKFFDFDSDTNLDALAFIPYKKLDEKNIQVPALWINGVCYNQLLKEDYEPYSVAVVDVVKDDKYKEIVVLYNSKEGKCAGFYRYNGADLFQIKANNSEDGMIFFNKNIFVDGIENVVSDLDGLCFLDSMICTGVYSLEEAELCRYMLKLTNIVEKNFIRTFTDDLPYYYKKVQEYDKAEYVDGSEKGEILCSNDLGNFKVLDYYVDGQDPTKFEFYIQLPNKDTMVIWPFK